MFLSLKMIFFVLPMFQIPTFRTKTPQRICPSVFRLINPSTNTFLYLSTISFYSISYDTAVINPLTQPPNLTHTQKFPNFPLSSSAAAAVAAASQLRSFVALYEPVPMSSTSLISYLFPAAALPSFSYYYHHVEIEKSCKLFGRRQDGPLTKGEIICLERARS